MAAHLLTALGAALGFLALVAVVDGRFDLCFAWLGAALVVDGVDGTLARRVRASETAAFIDGAALDLVVDYLTYVAVPLFAVLRHVSGSHAFLLICVLVAMVGSALYFADRRMKTDDLWFRGFPACWNVVALYIFVFKIPAPAAAAILLIGTVLLFAPFASTHPVRVVRWRIASLVASAIWLASAAFAVWSNFEVGSIPQGGLILSGLYFLAISVLRGRLA